MRRPLETRLLDLIETHPIAANLSAAAAYAWLRLGRAIAGSGELDTLRLRPGLATLEELARAFRLSVTEAARGLDELIRKGCLLACEGGFQLPDWTGVAATKAISARNNGRKHRAAGAQEQRRLPLLTVIRGDRASVTDATTTTSENQSSKKAVVAPANEAETIAQELGEIAELTAAQARRSAGRVDVWLQMGITVDTMRAAIQHVLQRPNRPPITGLGYFDGAIRDASRAALPRAASMEEPVDPLQQRARKAWQALILAWQGGGCVGPMPPRLEHFMERERLSAVA